MAKTWKVIMKSAGSYNIEGITLDFERGIPFIDVFEEIGDYLVLKNKFLNELIEALKSNSHYIAFKGMEVVSPEGDVLTKQEIELGVVIAFTLRDRIIGFLYNLNEKGLEILGLWPRELARLYKDNEKWFLEEVFKLINNPSYFKGVSFLFPHYYPY